ncbi:hypothetical protein CP532_5691 [Ophiocordyceps camponoti-leonardi (nom. inval.)]|nr:hypothetical protein CP532_5691 [Ophiocordyceps camponoti-leonardi (nom. inval.)]
MLPQKASPLPIVTLDQVSSSMLEFLPWVSCGVIGTDLKLVAGYSSVIGDLARASTDKIRTRKLDPDPGGRKTARKSVRSVLFTSVARKGAANTAAGDAASDSTVDATKDDAVTDATREAAREAAWKAVTDAIHEATQQIATRNAKKNTASSVPSQGITPKAVHAPIVVPEYSEDARKNFHLVRVPRRRHTRSDPPAKALETGKHPSPGAAPDQEPTAQAVPTPTPKSKTKKFEAAAFDAGIYSQAGAVKPPAGVSIQPPQKARPSCPENDRVYVHANPAIHRSHNRSEAWHEEKAREIKDRGGRKAWSGKVVKRIQWTTHVKESRSKEKDERRTTPQPRTFSRPLDFGDVPESKLPDDVRKNPAWLKACEWFRNVKQLQDLREQAARRSEFETRQFYGNVVGRKLPLVEENRFVETGARTA